MHLIAKYIGSEENKCFMVRISDWEDYPAAVCSPSVGREDNNKLKIKKSCIMTGDW
jgi:hypothetical protein